MLKNMIEVFTKYQIEGKIGNVYRSKELRLTAELDRNNYETFVIMPSVNSFNQGIICGEKIDKHLPDYKKFKYVLLELYWELTEVSDNMCDYFNCLPYSDDIDIANYNLLVGDN